MRNRIAIIAASVTCAVLLAAGVIILRDLLKDTDWPRGGAAERRWIVTACDSLGIPADPTPTVLTLSLDVNLIILKVPSSVNPPSKWTSVGIRDGISCYVTSNEFAEIYRISTYSIIGYRSGRSDGRDIDTTLHRKMKSLVDEMN